MTTRAPSALLTILTISAIGTPMSVRNSPRLKCTRLSSTASVYDSAA